ncbi:MAG: hypothetical protein IJO32_05840 [Bacilli bacterium]|nr:hypothetical protein [Bacilli bacterium]
MFNILSDTDLCTSSMGYRLFGFLGHILNIIQIVIPIILIVIGTIELIKSLISNLDDNKKVFSKLIVKLVFAALIFFVPIIVRFLIGMVTSDTANACIDCLSNPNYCNEKAEELSPLKCNDNESFKKDINCTDETCKDREDCKKLNDEWKCCIGNI